MFGFIRYLSSAIYQRALVVVSVVGKASTAYLVDSCSAALENCVLLDNVATLVCVTALRKVII
jgi:hypothetical protein